MVFILFGFHGCLLVYKCNFDGLNKRLAFGTDKYNLNALLFPFFLSMKLN